MRAVRATGLALWIFAAAAAPQAGDLADPAAALPGSSASLFNPWIRFHAGFDRGVAADLAEGNPEPVQRLGSPALVDGLLGNALRTGVKGGGAQLSYARAANLDLARPGALSFWVRATDWRNKAPQGESGYVRFVRLRGKGSSIFVLERDVRRPGVTEEQLVMGFFTLSGGEEYYLVQRAGPRWTPEAWHLVVVSWDSTGFAASVDGGAFVRKAVPGDRIRAHFGAAPASAFFIVGDDTRESFLLDDLSVYARPLRDQEARRLYEAGVGSKAAAAPTGRNALACAPSNPISNLLGDAPRLRGIASQVPAAVGVEIAR